MRALKLWQLLVRLTPAFYTAPYSISHGRFFLIGLGWMDHSPTQYMHNIWGLGAKVRGLGQVQPATVRALLASICPQMERKSV